MHLYGDENLFLPLAHPFPSYIKTDNRNQLDELDSLMRYRWKEQDNCFNDTHCIKLENGKCINRKCIYGDITSKKYIKYKTKYLKYKNNIL
jgi:hypothetical protein